MTNETPSWARLIGRSFAHLQHGVDRVCDWGFKKLNDVGSAKEEEAKEPKNRYVRLAKLIGKKSLKFLGTTGREYYKEYENLKKKS